MNKERKRILLVEPEAVLAEVTAFRLELHGYEVVIANSAEEAIQEASRTPPDLVLTDLVLPGMGGLELVEQLSVAEETSDIPIIVLSVDADLDRVQTLYGVGAKDFVVVPYHPQVLEEKVAKHLATAGTRKKPAKAPEVRVGSASPRAGG